MASRVGFICKPDSAEVSSLVEELVPWLVGEGSTPVFVDGDHISPPGATIVPAESFADGLDLAMVLGGDGTMLRAAKLVADNGVPVLGINIGRLGFLTPFEQSDALDALDQAIQGKLETAERLRLSATYVPRDGEPAMQTALNDVVIHQSAMARLIDLEARLDGALITTYRADGLIVATPTGSTAYNLAAGGPILYPGQANMTLTPICAHALTNRPLVLPHERHISISIDGDAGAALTIDGQWAHSVQSGDRVEITNSPHPLRLFLSEHGYFDILRRKLHWGVGTKN